ncbi:MAG: primosomal protein N' [Bacteroidota bacterium]
MSQLELNTQQSEGRQTLFADVILPVPIPRMFTYRVPFELNDFAEVGCRVIVQFGKRKILTGIIGSIHDQPPQKYEAKYLLELLDEHPVMPDVSIQLLLWIAEYYMSSLGEVLNIALPAGLKLSSESKIQLHPDFDFGDIEFDFGEKEHLILAALKDGSTLSYSEAGKIVQQKTIYKLLQSLVSKGAVLIFEEVKDKYKPKKETRVRINKSRLGELQLIFDRLSKQPKQEAVLLFYLQQVPLFENEELNESGILKSSFKSNGLSESSLNTLIKNGILEQFEIVVSRFGASERKVQEITLTEKQREIKTRIINEFRKRDIILFHGITGSGKTEVYVKLIQEALEGSSQVLYLLPEIALTTQIVARLKKVFGDKMGVYHSKFSDNERVEVWRGVLNGTFQVVVGVRSSIFLPFDNLGLIIVDEEHESSYKQYDPAPRYNARDTALVLAGMHHAKVLLGSATPSIESYYNALDGKYGLVELSERFGEGKLPRFTVANMILERKKKLLKGEFSAELVEEIKAALHNQQQVILFQNRRGYSPYISCENCGWIPKCENCAVSLTYHQYRQEIVCHYCGYKEPTPRECDACGSTDLKTMGFGTEKIEEELQLLFPKAQIQRMDLDTTRNKYSYETIIGDFEKGTVDILVGTQMVSKGLDFDKVSLVGIFDIDRMLHFPDFRSYERTFQLATQVSGRAGRKNTNGQVIIQSRNPDIPLLKQIIEHDYRAFYQSEIIERKDHLYPPFTRLINITVKNKDKNLAELTARKIANLLREKLGYKRVLGPEEPVISRIRNEYLMNLIIKMERRGVDITRIKMIVKETVLEILAEKQLKTSRIVFNVDPV